MDDAKYIPKEEKIERLNYLKLKHTEYKKEIAKLEKQISENTIISKQLEIITFNNTKIKLYDNYLILNEFIAPEKRINKQDISCFNIIKKSNFISSHNGNIGLSVKVARGVHIRKSTPYNTTTRINSYTPKIMMTDCNEIVLETAYENENSHYNYDSNIKILNMWKDSKNTEEFYSKKAEYLLEVEKSKKLDSNIVTIIIGWFLFLVLSIIIGNSSFILTMFLMPTIAVYFLMLFKYLKQKKWIISLIILSLGILVCIGFSI